MTVHNRISQWLGAAAGVLLGVGAAQGQTTWFVDDDGSDGNGCTSWADACPDVQTALALATASDQIWVAEGTYTPDSGSGDRLASFALKSGVAIYGGFDGTEIAFAARGRVRPDLPQW